MSEESKVAEELPPYVPCAQKLRTVLIKGTCFKDRKDQDLWIFRVPPETVNSLPKQRNVCLSYEALIQFPFLLACEEHPGIWRVFGSRMAMEAIDGELALNLAMAEWSNVQLCTPQQAGSP